MSADMSTALVPMMVTSRAQRIARWLAQNIPAPVVSELVVLCQQSDSWELVARFPVASITRDSWVMIGQAIDETVRGIANEMRTRIAARAVYYTTEGKEWVGLPLVVAPDNPEDERPNLDGSALSLIKQCQTHSEAAVRMCMSSVGELVGHLREVIADQRQGVAELRAQNERLLGAVEEAHEEVAEAEENAEIALEEATAAADAAEEAMERSEGDKSSKVLRLIAQAAGMPAGVGG